MLQQLPTAETVTPANWPEVLRAVGLLTRDLEVPLDGAAAAARAAAALSETGAPPAIAAAVCALEGGGYGALDLGPALTLFLTLTPNPNPNPDLNPNPNPNPNPNRQALPRCRRLRDLRAAQLG